MIYTEMTIKALKLAYAAHEGQLDYNGVPYIFHPYHIAEQMPDETTCTVALLHDVVEDTAVTLDALAKEFPTPVVEAVGLLTHADGADYFEYLQRIKQNPIAKTVKLGDIQHNADQTRCVGSSISKEKLLFWQNKYQNAKEYLLAP